jgi:hypothetical protein
MIVALSPPDLLTDPRFIWTWTGSASNDLGQVIFLATVDVGGGNLQGVLLVAT